MLAKACAEGERGSTQSRAAALREGWRARRGRDNFLLPSQVWVASLWAWPSPSGASIARAWGRPRRLRAGVVAAPRRLLRGHAAPPGPTVGRNGRSCATPRREGSTGAGLVVVLGTTMDAGELLEREGVGSREQRRESCVLAPTCLLYTSPSPRDGLLSRMPSSA